MGAGTLFLPRGMSGNTKTPGKKTLGTTSPTQNLTSAFKGGVSTTTKATIGGVPGGVPGYPHVHCRGRATRASDYKLRPKQEKRLDRIRRVSNVTGRVE